MSTGKRIIRLLPCFMLVITACVESYQPVVHDQDQSLLVVDGFINATTGNANVRLSHSSSLSNTDAPEPEQHALVKIETGNGNTYILNEGDSGNYFFEGIPIDHQATHRLHIFTSTGREIISDNLIVTTTTPIDSVTSEGEYDGLSIMVSTHDPAANSKYYAWEYIETWEYHSLQVSSFKLVDKAPIPRTAADAIYRCYQTHVSTNLHTATSDALNGDVISEFPIIKIPAGSVKLSVRYSVLVRQRVVSKQEYEFLDDLRKTTENLGGVFGTLPGKVVGNLHDVTNPEKPVLGYFSGGEISEKRFWIEYIQLPPHLQIAQAIGGCQLSYICVGEPPPPFTCAFLMADISGTEYIIAPVGNPQWGWSFTSYFCADCRSHGGVLKQPDFW